MEATAETTALDLHDTTDVSDAQSALHNLRLDNIVRMTIRYLNINSIRNEFDA